ncbi:MAG TPA: L-rhamnose isomerase, partial [Pantoea sp.]|nr:L-rhamnose isomerase [Pantoea sp.]
MTKQIEQAFELAKQRYADIGVDVEQAIRQLDAIPVSMHCWQGDDVRGFENPQGALTGGIQATGNYPGRARNAGELRNDIDKAMSLIPGAKRPHLHAIYLESDKRVAREEIEPETFANWVSWDKGLTVGPNSNP